VGGLALQYFLEHHPEDSWVAELLLEQYLMWSRWWSAARQFDAVGHRKDQQVGLIAPGSTRDPAMLPIECSPVSVHNRVDVVTGETGLVRAPLVTCQATPL
jgi:hypothetical protein